MQQTAIRTDRRLREPGLLAGESRKQYLRLRKELYDEIKPSGAIECGYVDWIASLTWEIQRWLRIKADLIDGAALLAHTRLDMGPPP